MIVNNFITKRMTGWALIALLFGLLQACGGSDDDGGGDGNTDVNKTSSCLTDNQNYVNTNFNNINITPTRGGQLYDKWWVTADVVEPTMDHDMWNDRASNPQNTTSGSGTWRCKECHGWDYKGASGAYGLGSSHYTNFKGIDGATGKQAATVFCAIWDGTGLSTGQDDRHSFNLDTTGLSQRDVLAITKFILAVGPKRLVDTDEFVNSAKSALGDDVAGQTVYTTSAGCGNTSCHGANGDNNMGGHLLGELATDNPWEVLHKIRYGHPGASMPSFIDDRSGQQLTETQIKNVLAYAQTMPGSAGGGGGSTPTTVEQLVLGGLYYDDWMAEKGVSVPSFPPDNNNPLWAYQTTNTRIGADTWRCKECHGWDYKGASGQYGDVNSSHYTGFPGILDAAQSRSEEDIFNFLKFGLTDPINGGTVHSFEAYLTDAEITALAKFVKQGTIDTNSYISPFLGFARGDAVNGADKYNTKSFGEVNGNCELCHGTNGQTINFGTPTVPEYLGDLARDNPWEVLHKARFGQPNSNMVGMVSSEMSLQESVDVLTYAQTLP
jgi:thiosulfate dehydrogenase